jgi:SAM-dependent methyltransferase
MNRRERIFRTAEEENRRAILAACHPRRGARLLDLGCGDGEFTMRVAQRVGAGEVHGVEFIEPVAELARARGVTVSQSSLGERLPYEDGSFDAIHSNQVIEHLPFTDHFLREIRRLLAPGGYAVVSTNNLASWHNVVSLALGWQPMPNHVSDEIIVGNPANFVEGAPGAVGQNHLRVFTGRALAALAEFHGLKVELARTAGYYPLLERGTRLMNRLDPLHGAFLVQRYVAG